MIVSRRRMLLLMILIAFHIAPCYNTLLDFDGEFYDDYEEGDAVQVLWVSICNHTRLGVYQGPMSNGEVIYVNLFSSTVNLTGVYDWVAKSLSTKNPDYDPPFWFQLQNADNQDCDGCHVNSTKFHVKDSSSERGKTSSVSSSSSVRSSSAASKTVAASPSRTESTIAANEPLTPTSFGAASTLSTTSYHSSGLPAAATSSESVDISKRHGKVGLGIILGIALGLGLPLAVVLCIVLVLIMIKRKRKVVSQSEQINQSSEGDVTWPKEKRRRGISCMK